MFAIIIVWNADLLCNLILSLNGWNESLTLVSGVNKSWINLTHNIKMYHSKKLQISRFAIGHLCKTCWYNSMRLRSMKWWAGCTHNMSVAFSDLQISLWLTVFFFCKILDDTWFIIGHESPLILSVKNRLAVFYQ